jgi:hypothetical protein
MNIAFTSNAPGAATARLASLEESLFTNGRWVSGRRLNGDETGHNSRRPFLLNFGIYRIKLYERN